MVKADTMADALSRWCEKRGTETGVKEFVGYLKKHKNTHILPAVLKIFKERTRQKKRRNTLQIATGRRLTDEQINSLRTALNAPDDTPTKTTKDSSLIGGVACEYADKRIELTVRSQLKKLARSLNIN